MEAHPPALGSGRAGEQARRRLAALEPLRPFPPPDDLPVVVAARMSLSFPLLISAIPLRALDMTRPRTRKAVAAVEEGTEPAESIVAETCWFSDGGIVSNFPVHFFDAPLPTRPTFAIDLTASIPIIRGARTRPTTSTCPPRTSAACWTAGTGSTRTPASADSSGS